MISASLSPRTLNEVLDPARINYTSEFHLLDNLLAKLVSFDENGNYLLDLASDIQKIDDLNYKIKIKDRKFSNGEKITIKDVRSSIERNIRIGGAHISLNDSIQEIQDSNDALAIKLKKPLKSLFYYLSLPDLGILHRDQYSKETLHASDFTKVTSGAFYYQCINSCSLLKNKYFSSDLEYPNEVKLYSPFKLNIVNELMANRIHLGQVGLDDFLAKQEEVTSKESLKFLGNKTDSLTYLYFNKHSKNKVTINERKWLYSKIAKSFEILDQYKNISAKTIQYFPPESIAHIDTLEINDLEDGQNTPERFKSGITIHTFTTSSKVTIWDQVKHLEKIHGLKIQIVADIPPAELETKLKEGKIDIVLSIMSSDYRVPVEALNFEFFSPNSNATDETGEIKKLYNEYQKSNSIDEDSQCLKKISKIILDNAYFVPIFTSASPYFYNSDKVDFGALNSLFAFNFWKIKAK